MLSSKVFVSGNSQAVRLPKEYQVEDKELYIQKIGKAIILIPKSDPWDVFETWIPATLYPEIVLNRNLNSN